MAQKNENVVSREKELLERQVTRRGGGQASREDQDQREEIEQTSKVSIPMEERLKKFREEAAEEERSSTQAQNIKPKIQRVPFMLREYKNFDKYYEPRVAAIGPFHHGNPKYEQAEKVKRYLAAKFVKDSEQNDEDFLKKVEENIKELRECYDEEATKKYDDDSLTWMLFIDGCSTLEFIYKYEELESFKIKRDQVAFAEQDMFLLENQLPYQLLKLLMLVLSSSKHEHLKESIESFVQMHGVAPSENQKPQQGARKLEEKPPQPGAGGAQNTQPRADQVRVSVEPEPTHLLELLLTRMLGYPPKKSETSASAQPEAVGARNTQPHLLKNLRTKMKGYLPKKKRKSRAQSFRNVQELQAAGIHFRHSKEGNFLGNIYFKSYICCGFLYIPKIKVDDSMGPKFMNLIAYEMCPDFQNDFGVTSYISFLDSLIDHPDDVKHLRKKHILRNLLGSDEEVAKLFNEIGTDLVPNNAIYSKVKRDIEKHYMTKWKKWVAQFFHEHFSSPWTILAFIGALLGLWMTAVQTWYTVNSDTPPCEALLEYLKARGH
ncbi:UPF0481 protein At3g47200-like [Prunus avium]|uniref:UPF0481 protein At3g47200-like n=1 Tax=Prunus avium TaxID=42229 RepID=A0A6P5TSL2_PRUAV|nr:UPF0481 protein At3g47200-like [Prunus avium]